MMNKAVHPVNGFTLIEFLVVLAIMAMFVSLVIPEAMDVFGTPKGKTTREQLEEFSAALDFYHRDTGHYPTSEQGLQALVEQVEGVDDWSGPYLKENLIPKDPWGSAYIYRSPGEEVDYELYSLGADRIKGGKGEAEDIYASK
jgi:general secretion pathway protein G